MSVVVGIIAWARGRSGIGYFFVSVILSPLIADRRLLTFPARCAGRRDTCEVRNVRRTDSEGRSSANNAVTSSRKARLTASRKLHCYKHDYPAELYRTSPRPELNAPIIRSRQTVTHVLGIVRHRSVWNGPSQTGVPRGERNSGKENTAYLAVISTAELACRARRKSPSSTLRLSRGVTVHTSTARGVNRLRTPVGGLREHALPLDGHSESNSRS